MQIVTSDRKHEKADDLEKELSSLRKLWLILALICLVISINIIIATQGGAVKLSLDAALGFDFDKDVPEAIAGLWGIIYLTVFVGLSNAVLRAHALKCPGNWAERLPFRTFDLPTTRGVGLGAQSIAFLILLLLPIYTLGHSWRTMLNHGVLCVEVSEADWRPRTIGADAFFFRPIGAEAGPMRLTSNEATSDELGKASSENPKRCQKNKMTDYRAPEQTWIMAILSLFAVFIFCWSLLALFRQINPDNLSPSQEQ